MPIRSRTSSIIGQIELEHLELFAHEFGKITEYDFFYTLSSTNINQSAPNLVTKYLSIRSQMNMFMGQVIPDQTVLSAFGNRKIEL